MAQAILADGVEATAGSRVYNRNGTEFTVESVAVSPISPAGRANVNMRRTQFPGEPAALADSLNLASSPSWWSAGDKTVKKSTLTYVAIGVGGVGLLGGLLWWLWPRKH